MFFEICEQEVINKGFNELARLIESTHQCPEYAYPLLGNLPRRKTNGKSTDQRTPNFYITGETLLTRPTSKLGECRLPTNPTRNTRNPRKGEELPLLKTKP